MATVPHVTAWTFVRNIRPMDCCSAECTACSCFATVTVTADNSDGRNLAMLQQTPFPADRTQQFQHRQCGPLFAAVICVSLRCSVPRASCLVRPDFTAVCVHYVASCQHRPAMSALTYFEESYPELLLFKNFPSAVSCYVTRLFGCFIASTASRSNA